MPTQLPVRGVEIASVAPIATARVPRRLRATWPTIAALIALTKPRLATLTVITAFVGYIAARPEWDPIATSALLLGTALAAGGALALNQWRERDTDCLMMRTRNRPLPRQFVSPSLALGWGAGLAAAGPGLLALTVSRLAALIAIATIVLYAAVYTPLKKRTRWATEIGAIPGALPPVLGWAAADGSPAGLGGWLFAVLFCWQMPHFFAIGWLCRRDYRAAHFPLLPAIDSSGARTARWTLAYTLTLAGVSLAPCFLGHAGALYGTAAFAGAAVFLRGAWRFVTVGDERQRDRAAKAVFGISLLYLPLVWLALVLDRLW